MRPDTIIEKCETGGHFTESEIAEGLEFFSSLEKELTRCGPVFRMARGEAGEIIKMLRGYQVNRIWTGR